jgi:hypothetical protein
MRLHCQHSSASSYPALRLLSDGEQSGDWPGKRHTDEVITCGVWMSRAPACLPSRQPNLPDMHHPFHLRTAGVLAMGVSLLDTRHKWIVKQCSSKLHSYLGCISNYDWLGRLTLNASSPFAYISTLHWLYVILPALHFQSEAVSNLVPMATQDKQTHSE